MQTIPAYLRNGVLPDPTSTLHAKFLAKNPKTSKVLHENKSQGVLYEFRQASRVWTERQRKLLVIGGDYDGQMMTKHEIETSKYPTSYLLYKASGKGYNHPALWVYFKKETEI